MTTEQVHPSIRERLTWFDERAHGPMDDGRDAARSITENRNQTAGDYVGEVCAALDGLRLLLESGWRLRGTILGTWGVGMAANGALIYGSELAALARGVAAQGPAQPARTDHGHASDCALHNEPAYPAGPCDCDHRALDVLDGIAADVSVLSGSLDARMRIGAHLAELRAMRA